MRSRFGRPPLLGTMARTAAVAGTATAVSGRVAAKQQAAQQRAAQPQTATAPSPDLVERVRELAALREQGALTEEEFTALKAKLIAG